MLITECAIAVQANNDQSETSSAHDAGYLVWALLAIVLGLIVLIIVRTSARRSQKR